MTDFGPLFDVPPPPVSPPRAHTPEVQAAELARALSQNERYIVAFLRERIRQPGRQFHGKELLAYVNEKRLADGLVECAPDTPRRLITELEAQGCCHVLLLNRRASLYEVVDVSEE